MKKRDCLITQENKREIFWQIINSLLVGMISFLSAMLATEDINIRVVGVSLISAAMVFLIQFGNYWKNEESEYSDKRRIFNFFPVF